MKNTVLFFLLFTYSICNAQINLVKNGDFEKELENWRGDATVSPYDKHTGKNSCTINQFVGQEWKGIDQLITIPKNTYAIEFSVWIKTDQVEGGKEAYNAGIMTVEFANATGKSISYENIAQVKGTTQWTLYKKTLMIPEGSKTVRIMLALAQTNGGIFYDEVKAVTLSEDDYLKVMQQEALAKRTAALALAAIPKELKNGNFEDQLNNWSGTAEITSTNPKEGNYAVIISSKNPDWTGIDQAADIPKNTKSIEISGWLKAEDIKQGKESWNNGMFIAEFTSDGKNKTTDDQLIGTVTGTSDWKPFQKTIAIPEGTQKIRIMLALSNCTGALLADGISLKMISE